MFYRINLSKTDSVSGIKQNHGFQIAPQPSEVLLERLGEATKALGLGGLKLTKPSSLVLLPEAVPRVFVPNPEAILGFMGSKLTAESYSALCLKLLELYGGGDIHDHLARMLREKAVKLDPSNVAVWKKRMWLKANEGDLGVYEFGFNPATQFTTEGKPYNLSVTAARPLLSSKKSVLPGSLFEWIICSCVLYPEVHGLVAETSLKIAHPGSMVKKDDAWTEVTCFSSSGGKPRLHCQNSGVANEGSALFTLPWG
jgi:hypothetical protein